jgi:hypothetical protein
VPLGFPSPRRLIMGTATIALGCLLAACGASSSPGSPSQATSQAAPPPPATSTSAPTPGFASDQCEIAANGTAALVEFTGPQAQGICSSFISGNNIPVAFCVLVSSGTCVWTAYSWSAVSTPTVEPIVCRVAALDTRMEDASFVVMDTSSDSGIYGVGATVGQGLCYQVTTGG